MTNENVVSKSITIEVPFYSEEELYGFKMGQHPGVTNDDYITIVRDNDREKQLSVTISRYLSGEIAEGEKIINDNQFYISELISNSNFQYLHQKLLCDYPGHHLYSEIDSSIYEGTHYESFPDGTWREESTYEIKTVFIVNGNEYAIESHTV